MEGTNHFSDGPCSGFQFVAFNTREEATADRERRQEEERIAVERRRQEELEQAARIEAQRETARLAAAERARAIAAGEIPPPNGPSCPHCNSHFSSWSELFAHNGMGCTAPPASSSRSVFIR